MTNWFAFWQIAIAELSSFSSFGLGVHTWQTRAQMIFSKDLWATDFVFLSLYNFLSDRYLKLNQEFSITSKKAGWSGPVTPTRQSFSRNVFTQRIREKLRILKFEKISLILQRSAANGISVPLHSYTISSFSLPQCISECNVRMHKSKASAEIEFQKIFLLNFLHRVPHLFQEIPFQSDKSSIFCKRSFETRSSIKKPFSIRKFSRF